MRPRGTWTETFPYRDGEVTVTRRGRGWEVVSGPLTAEGATLVEAFEALLDRNVRPSEMKVIIEALERGKAFADDADSAAAAEATLHPDEAVDVPLGRPAHTT